MINQPSLDDIILRITFYMILCVRIFQ